VTPVSFSWTTTDTETWELQVASDAAFATLLLGADAAVTTTSGGVRTLGVSAQLDPAIGTYYWRVRQKSDKPWGGCTAVFSFKGIATTIKLIEPHLKDGNGIYKTDPDVHFVWSAIPGVGSYSFNIQTTKPAACPTTADPQSLTTFPFPLSTSPTSEADGFGWFHSVIPFDGVTTYYAVISSVGADQTTLGSCLVVPFKNSPLTQPATVLYPKQGDVVPFEQVPFLVFTPVPGAVAYRVYMQRVLTEVPAVTFEEVYVETRDASDLTVTTPTGGAAAFIKYDIDPAIAAGTGDDQLWSVTAIDADGFESFHRLLIRYHVAAGAPSIVTPMNGASSVNNDSVPLSWSALNGTSRYTTYKVTLEAGSVKTSAVAGHSGEAGAVQQGTITALAKNTTYMLTLEVQSTPAYTDRSAWGDPPNLTTVSKFTTAAPTPLPAPKLLWDSICEPAIPGLALQLDQEGATMFMISDVAGADNVELEFRDATDPNHVTDGVVTATASAICGTPQDGAGRGLCSPTVSARVCVVKEGSIQPAWTPQQEAAADGRARSLWHGFRYSVFRIRYNNKSNGTVGEWSRFGVMLSCIDTNLCSFTRGGGLVGPVGPLPDVYTPQGVDPLCDDAKFAQWDAAVIPESDCVQWH